MKKVLSLMLCAAVLFLCAACGSTKEKTDLPDTPPARGSVNGLDFVSEYTDVAFSAPSDNWVFATDEELASACNIDPKVFATEDFETLLKNNSTVYDMIAQSEKDRIAVLMGIENPKLSAVTSTSSAKDFVNKVLDSFLQTIDTENNPYTLSDTEAVTICGHEYYRKSLTISTADDTATQSYYARSLGDYLCIIVTSHTADTTVEQVEALFDR